MKKIIIVVLGLWFSLSAFAQGNRSDVEQRYRSQKIAFITDKMQLTPEEAQEFWPLYKQLEAAKDALGNEIHKYREDFPEDKADMTEEQAKAYLAFFNKHNEAMFKLNLEYQKKILKVISSKKLLLLNDAENEFRRHLLREFRGKGANSGKGGIGRPF